MLPSTATLSPTQHLGKVYRRGPLPQTCVIFALCLRQRYKWCSALLAAFTGNGYLAAAYRCNLAKIAGRVLSAAKAVPQR